MRDHEIAAAGITDPGLVNAYRVCGARLRGRNPAAYPETRCLLPAAKRPYYDAMLAICRHIDDLLDDPERSTHERADRFNRFQGRLAAVFDGNDDAAADPASVDHQVALAFVHFIRTCGISWKSVGYVMRAISGDLEVVDYPTYPHLENYMRAVSGEPATWINALLEPRDPDAERQAIALSHAVYLLDFVHDVAEDLSLGRVYLPQEDLVQVGLSRDDLGSAVSGDAMTESVRQLVRLQAERVERLLTESEEWWRLVHPSSRWFVRRYHALCRVSLRRLIRRDYDALRSDSPVRAAWQRGTTLGGTGLTLLRAVTDRHRNVRSPRIAREAH